MQPEYSCQSAGPYTIHTLLGDGGQAKVYLGSKNEQLVAVKVYFSGQSKLNAFKLQADFLQKLSYPNLINMVDAIPDALIRIDSEPEEKRPILVLELAEGGQLFDFISKTGRFSPEVTRLYAKQLINAISYLNGTGYAHRDLKPENILFDKQYQLKVSDFGLSTLSQGHDKDGVLYSRVGTQGYKPPEMELGKYEGIQADIFAAGVVIFIIFNGTPPFISTKNSDRIYKLIRDKNFAKFWALHEKKKPAGFYPQSFKRLMNGFFSYDPTKRPTLQELNQDQWLNGDVPMAEELKQFMKERYNKIKETDPVKQKIEAIKQEKFMNQIMKDQCCDQSTRADPSDFLKDYREIKENIQIENLSVTNKKIALTKQTPAFVLAWIKEYVRTCQTEKETFVNLDFYDSVEPEEYTCELLEKNNIQLKFLLNIDGLEEQEIEIQGELVRNADNCVGFDWSHKAGNDFWANGIISNINNSLKCLS